MSIEKQNIMHNMLLEMSTMKYAYRSTLEGCFEYLIERRGMDRPEEPRDEIIDEVMRIFATVPQPRVY
jgi:hypothetical protein